MLIDQLELKKICIKYAQFDPHPIWQFVSGFTKKRVEKTLNELHEKYLGNTQAVEEAVVRMISENSQGRRKQFAKYLLMAAIPKKMISVDKAKEMAGLLGLSGPDLDAYMTQHFGEEPQVDIFDELAGSGQPTQQPTETPQLNSMQQDLQIAASFTKRK